MCGVFFFFFTVLRFEKRENKYVFVHKKIGNIFEMICFWINFEKNSDEIDMSHSLHIKSNIPCRNESASVF